MQQPQGFGGAVQSQGLGGAAGLNPAVSLLPPQAWQLLPAAVCESLMQVMTQRPNLGPAVTDMQGLAQLAGLSVGARERVLQSLWSMPVPPVASMSAGLLQMMCATAGP
jgi:hypothetical protein